MAVTSVFVGINKYRDNNIRDLTGASRDALALSCLFKDSISEIDITLLTDETATNANIKTTISTILEKATANDTVIISFSGHGTNDHRLVSYDSDVSNLHETTLCMDQVVQWFRQSNANIILFILDCCFSGQVPAKILESSPTSRNPVNPVYQLEGAGKYIFSACNIDESAYEIPSERFGLLTKSLIDEMYAQSNSFDFLNIISGTIEKVRVGASKMGVLQTPVFFGASAGGLVLPRLIKGPSYSKNFPESSRKITTNKLRDLIEFGLPSQILSIWEEKFKDGLNELQLEAINQHRILDGDSLLVVAPTSAGKTFIGELASVKATSDGKKTVFLLPYKALVNEKYDYFNSIYSSIGLRIIRVSGDYLDETGALFHGKYDLSLMTYELFLNLITSSPSIINQIGLIVIDEAQFITDSNRGITVELLLSYLITLRTKGIAPQLIALSAVIGQINDFDGWLGCNKLVSEKRPVPLIEGVLDRSGQYKYKDSIGNIGYTQLLPNANIRIRKKNPGSQDLIVPLVSSLVKSNEKVLVFRNSRGSAQGCAKYLAADLMLPPLEENIIDLLPNADLSTSSTSLRECLNGGTAFHNANLTREEKQIVERSFNDVNSNVKVLVATTTVAAGINTPASSVIISELYFKGEEERNFTVAEYKNMAGRAGRLGYQEEGKVYILADTIFERDRLFNTYVLGQPEDLKSSFEIDQMNTWLIRLLAQVQNVHFNDVTYLLANTYGGYLANKNNPKWYTFMEQEVTALLEIMLKYELVEYEGDFIHLTLLGRACGRSSLQFNSALRLVEILKQSKDLSVEKLIALIQILPESDSGFTPMFKKGAKERVRPSEASGKFGQETIKLLQKYARDDFDYYARCKRCSILWDWINGVTIENIEEAYSSNLYSRISYGDIKKFADNTRFHLRAAFQIYTTLFIEEHFPEEQIENILKRLELGLPQECLSLLELPHSFTRGEYLSLRNAGIKNSTEFASFKQSNQIPTLFSKERIRQLQLSRGR